MKKALVEFIGTFFLVFTIGCVVQSPAPGVIAPLAIGAVLIAMIYAGGHVSGAHYNPAVTLAMLVNRSIKPLPACGYLAAQFLAAVVAALAVNYLRPVAPEVAELVPAPAFLVEFLFTFALVFVIMNVALAAGTGGNDFYGWAIGLTVMAGAFAVGDLSGAAFNPAVAVAIVSMGMTAPSGLPLYFGATLLGAVVAVFAYRAVQPAAAAAE